MIPKKLVHFTAWLFIVFLFSSCSKDVLHHGIKGKVINTATGQPYANGYVDISYYTSSCGMGIITKCGTVGEGKTDSEGNFKITFQVKKFHLEEGEFSVRIIKETIVTPITAVSHEDLKDERIVNVGPVETEF